MSGLGDNGQAAGGLDTPAAARAAEAGGVEHRQAEAIAGMEARLLRVIFAVTVVRTAIIAAPVRLLESRPARSERVEAGFPPSFVGSLDRV